MFHDHDIGNIRSTYAVVAIEISNKFHGAQEKILLGCSAIERFSLQFFVVYICASTLCAFIRLKEEICFFLFFLFEPRIGKQKGATERRRVLKLISHLRKCSSTDI